MSYMIEGGGSTTMSRAKAWLYSHKEESHQLLTAITEVNTNNCLLLLLLLLL